MTNGKQNFTPGAGKNSDPNPSMEELFRQEVGEQTALMIDDLSKLTTQDNPSKTLENLVKCSQTIKGISRLVNLDIVTNLATELENTFSQILNQSIKLAPNQIEILLSTVDFLLQISRIENTQISDFIIDQAEKFEDTTQSLRNLFALESQSSLSASVPSVRDQPIEKIAEIAPKKQEIIAENVEIEDTSMLDLFKMEVEAQTNILNNQLLALENQSNSQQALESLMRAAHSIKGAARIVGINTAVNLAHIMEDCFVNAQNQAKTDSKLPLQSNDIDILLEGSDLLLEISQVSPSEMSNWLVENQEKLDKICQSIGYISHQKNDQNTAISKPPLIQAKIPENPPPVKDENEAVKNSENNPNIKVENISISLTIKPEQETKKTVDSASNISSSLSKAKEPSAIIHKNPINEGPNNQDRVVRVSAENLNRIMGLAGESLIDANWLQPFADSMTVLKKRQMELSKILENFQNKLTMHDYEDAEKLLELSRNKERECREILADRLSELELFARRTTNLSDRLYREVIASHMRPFADGVQSFPRMVRDVARQLGKQVKLEISGKATKVDRDILTKLEAPLTQILRNAVDHGIELPDKRISVGKNSEGIIKLEALHRGGMLSITITDDGQGIDLEKLRQKIVSKNLSTLEMVQQMNENELLDFLFLPGFSTAQQVTEISGRGVGLDIAKMMADEVGGTVRVNTKFGQGTTFSFQLPLTLSVVRTLLVEIAKESYAFPLARIDQLVTIDRQAIQSVENRQYFTMDHRNIGLVSAAQVLELPETTDQQDTLSVVVISEQSDYYGLVVDRFIGEHDLVVRPLDSRLGKVQDINAAALMGDGSPILIVDVSDIVRSVNNLLNGKPLTRFSKKITNLKIDQTKHILVVDDSITVREMERKILQNRGYQVDIAVDGMEGWHAVCSNEYDLVISDIDMPRMNGLELVSKIKNHPKLQSIPVIIVSYKDREEDRIKGLEVGANYYLTKSSFHDDSLIKAVRDLIGAPDSNL